MEEKIEPLVVRGGHSYKIEAHMGNTLSLEQSWWGKVELGPHGHLGGSLIKEQEALILVIHSSIQKLVFDIARLSKSKLCKCCLAHESLRAEISTLASVNFECQPKERVPSFLIVPAVGV